MSAGEDSIDETRFHRSAGIAEPIDGGRVVPVLDGLPAGWASAISRRHGRPYFYHRATRWRTWLRPSNADLPNSAGAIDPVGLECPQGILQAGLLTHRFHATSGYWEVEHVESGNGDVALGEDSGGGWQACDPVALSAIEKISDAVRGLVVFQVSGQRFELELACGVQRDMATGCQRRLRRRSAAAAVSAMGKRGIEDVCTGGNDAQNGVAAARPFDMCSVLRTGHCDGGRDETGGAVASAGKSVLEQPVAKRQRDAELHHDQESKSNADLPAVDSKASGNDDIADIFEEMGAIYRVRRDLWRARAFDMAAPAIRAHPEPIFSGAQARTIRGVGDGIARRIDTILSKGELEEIAELKLDSDFLALRELRSVHGIGAVRAAELIEKGIRSIADVRVAVASGAIQLDPTQTVGLTHVEDFRKKIPRSEMVEHEAAIKTVRDERHPSLIMVVCSSYRRGKAFSGDIDVLLTTPKFTMACPAAGRALLREFVSSLRAAGYLTADLAAGEKKYMGACRLRGPARSHRRIDMRCLPHDSFHFGTLYFTGSKAMNIRMRQRAAELGLVLNEYGLERRGGGVDRARPRAPLEAVPLANSEQAVFEALGMAYLEPTER